LDQPPLQGRKKKGRGYRQRTGRTIGREILTEGKKEVREWMGSQCFFWSGGGGGEKKKIKRLTPGIVSLKIKII